MRLRYTPRARVDLASIYDYLFARAPALAQSVTAHIEERIARLAEFPFTAKAADVPGVRELVIARHPYKVFYGISGDEISILHIRHARRRPWHGQ